MENLTLGVLAEFVRECIENGIPLDTPVFIGQDDELNGIHTAWFAQTVQKGIEGDEDFIEMIEKNNNVAAKEINILIS